MIGDMPSMRLKSASSAVNMKEKDANSCEQHIHGRRVQISYRHDRRHAVDALEERLLRREYEACEELRQKTHRDPNQRRLSRRSGVGGVLVEYTRQCYEKYAEHNAPDAYEMVREHLVFQNEDRDDANLSDVKSGSSRRNFLKRG